MLSFQNCSPTNGFSSNEYVDNASLSSNLPDAPPEVPKLPDPSMKPCGGTLAPGESCFIGVQFTPTATGTRNGSIQIAADGQVVGEVALTGQGQ